MTGDRQDWGEKLERWANVGERGAPVAFAGREREIDFAIRQLEAWHPGTTPGRTVVAQGAPGAGKTALLGEIARRLPQRLPNAVAIYLPTPWIDDNVPNVLEELAVKMAGVPAHTLRTTNGSEPVAGVRAVAAARHPKSRSMSPPTLQTWRAFSREFEPVAHRMKPTLLLIDEIQRIGEGEATRDLLYHLHDQTTFPVVLVCGGLSTSAAQLGEVGLSRLDEGSILRIDALTATEAQRSLEESLGIMADDVGGIAGHPDRWARALAPPTQGWPQHVTCHFRAAAEALLESGRLAFDDATFAPHSPARKTTCGTTTTAGWRRPGPRRRSYTQYMKRSAPGRCGGRTRWPWWTPRGRCSVAMTRKTTTRPFDVRATASTRCSTPAWSPTRRT